MSKNTIALSETTLTQRDILNAARGLIQLARMWPESQARWREDEANRVALWAQVLAALEEVEATEDVE